MDTIKKTRLAGFFIFIALTAGIFSIAPTIDSINYLSEAAKNSNDVILAALFQFIMSLAYIGIAILLYPFLKNFNSSLAIGFLSFRIIAVTLSIIATLLLLSILTLSHEYINKSHQNTLLFEVVGTVFKISRDYINHVFMVLTLCIGNFAFYLLLFKSKLIPKYLSIWGLIGVSLAIIASFLVLFRLINIISFEYLILNAPTAIQELLLALWLMVKGFNKKIVKQLPGI